MVPADDELDRLAYVLGAPPPEAGTDLAGFVREWLADPPGAPDQDEPLRRGLATLAPRQRAAVVLRLWSGLPAAEVAELLDCDEHTVELETDAALDVLATDEERLTADLAWLADTMPVDEPPPNRRWRAAGISVGVLAAAGVFAAVLGLGDTGDPNADDQWRAPPTAATLQPMPAPALDNPAPTFDNRSRRLTAQLAAAKARALPGVEQIEPASVSGPGGEVLWAPLVFHVADDTPDLYLAMATLGSGRDATVLKIDIGYRNPGASRYQPCPHQQECSYRRFPDGTSGSVVVYSEPVSDQTINRLTAMRPDGTYVHVSVFFKDRRADPPPLGTAALFRFATVFTY
jgi:Sigma-70, region 4